MGGSPRLSAEMIHPTTLEDVATLISEIGSHKREILLHQAAHSETVDRMNQELQTALQAHADAIEARLAALLRFWDKNESTLTAGGKRKSALFSTGTMGVHGTKERVVTALTEEQAVALCKEREHPECVRTKEELDRTEILKHPEVVKDLPGISIEKGEMFFVKPNDPGVAVSKEVETLRVAR